MNHASSHLLHTIVVAVFVGLLSACAAKTSSPSGKPDELRCTTEAKMCPDGSGVGRTGPNCEFAPCPGAPAADGAAADAPAPDAAPAP